MNLLTKRIALLADNPAFGTIVAARLQTEPGVKVYAFESVEALATFARISPVDLMILDADSLPADFSAVVTVLREQPKRVSPEVPVMLLTRADAEFHGALLARGIDVVHSKPVSPVRLLDSVINLLSLKSAGPIVDGVYRGPERRRLGQARIAPAATATVVRHDNVVQLFGRTKTA